MTAALFYVDALPGAGELAVVDGDEGFHAASVRRIRAGEELDLGDGAGAVAHCVIEEVAKGQADGARAGALDRRAREADGDRRAGAAQVRPLRVGDRVGHRGGRRCVRGLAGVAVCGPLGRRPGRKRACGGGVRWPGRPRASPAGRYIPSVSGVVSTGDLVADVRDAVAAGTTVLVLHESATEPMTKLPVAQADSLMLVVGPEGGIADDEIAALSQAGASVVRLGPDGAADLDRRGRRTRRAWRADVALGLTACLSQVGVQVKHFGRSPDGGKLGAAQHVNRQEPRKQAENPR